MNFVKSEIFKMWFLDLLRIFGSVWKLTFTIVTIEDRQAQIIGYSFSGGFDKTFAFQVFRGENSRCDDFSGSLFDLKMLGNDVTNDNS